MVVFLYAGMIAGILLAALGIYLLGRLRKGVPADIDIPGLGKIKTSHHGVVVLALGVVMMTLSLKAAVQRDELQVTVASLQHSESMIVSFATPSMFGEPAFQNYFKAASLPQQAALRRRAADMLQPEFRHVTDTAQGAFSIEALTPVTDIYEFLLATNSHDGSGLYYKGEVQRLLRQRDPMRETFRLYLSVAPPPGRNNDDGSGYFDERTAWVNHLMANDFLCEALEGRNQLERDEALRSVSNHVREERKYRRSGFASMETTVSTDTLEQIVNGVTQVSQLHPRCPPMLRRRGADPGASLGQIPTPAVSP